MTFSLTHVSLEPPRACSGSCLRPVPGLIHSRSFVQGFAPHKLTTHPHTPRVLSKWRWDVFLVWDEMNAGHFGGHKISDDPTKNFFLKSLGLIKYFFEEFRKIKNRKSTFTKFLKIKNRKSRLVDFPLPKNLLLMGLAKPKTKIFCMTRSAS